jgi:hypothetical protein
VGAITQVWRLDELNRDTNFLFTTTGRSLHDNRAVIDVSFSDREGRSYSKTHTAYVMLGDRNIIHRIVMWLDRHFGKVEKQNN